MWCWSRLRAPRVFGAGYPAVDGLLVLGLKLPHTSVLNWNHPLAEIASGHVILEMNSKTDPLQELQQEQACHMLTSERPTR